MENGSTAILRPEGEGPTAKTKGLRITGQDYSHAVVSVTNYCYQILIKSAMTEVSEQNDVRPNSIRSQHLRTLTNNKF